MCLNSKKSFIQASLQALPRWKQIIFKSWSQQIVWILPGWTSFWWPGSISNYWPQLPTWNCTWYSALDEPPFNCSICDQAVRSQPQALEHNAAIHSEVKSVECDQCEERFPSGKRLTKHKQSHHSDKINLCVECDKYFVYKLSLRSHERKMHILKCVEQEFHGTISLSVICKIYLKKISYL